MLNESERFISYLMGKLDIKYLQIKTKEFITFTVPLDDPDNINAFQETASGASGLYKFFESLQLLNHHTISKKRREGILKNSNDYYSHNNIPVSADNMKPFIIDELWIKTKYQSDPINYRTLSDGEHQALTIMGLFNMIEDDGALFLLDEPETHLNPQWKYGFLDMLNQVTSSKKNQVFITTHDPVFISGLNKDEVVVFKSKDDLKREIEINKNSKVKVDKYWLLDDDLKGKGIDWILTSNIFQFNTTLDPETSEKMIERRILLGKKLSNLKFTEQDNAKLNELTKELSVVDGNDPLDDPIYREFVKEFSKRDVVSIYKAFATRDEKEKINKISKEILDDINKKK